MKALLLSLIFSVSAHATTEDFPVDPMNSLVKKNNELGLNFMKEVSAEPSLTEKNILTSPLSLYLALSMAYNGTSGQTKFELGQKIDAFQDLTSFNDFNQFFQKSLTLDEVPLRYEGEPKSPVLGIANSAWENSAPSHVTGGIFKFAPAYLKRLSAHYDATSKSLDFNDPASADFINEWAEKETRGLIPQVISPDELSKMMWVLMNATYFEANWREPFYKLNSKHAPKFNLLSGEQKTVEMIRNDTKMIRETVNGVDVIEVPFYNSNIAFYIANPNSAQEFQRMNKSSAWDPKFWTDILAQFSGAWARPGHLTLPKFAFKYSVALKKDDPLTQATGLNFLFQDFADFSEIAAPGSVPTAVGLIKQDTKIELDEYGVKAAAVTTIGGIEVTSMPTEPPFDVVIDKPFFFAIGDKSTGTLIFVGSVVDPTLTQ